ncbi:MAG: hypothetical protein NTY53_15860, partial [Kiritimatiellaeota bacterium]|nr:hypothetical protein [Kiritimatiellota bacterium]
MTQKFWIWAVALGLCLGTTQAQITIRKPGSTKAGIDWSRLVASGAGPTEFKRVLEDDLIHSGWFVPSAPGAEFTLIGTVQESGQITAQIQLSSASQQRWLLSKQYNHVADEILAAIGRKGMFSGHIAMLGTRSGAKELYVCDMDGGNLQQITSDHNICLAPRWAPDGQRITYTAFLKRFPDVYLVDLASRSRRVIASYGGMNSGGAISPDGSLVALTLSKDGSPNLYVRALNSGTPVRLTSEPRAAIASPCWSPDGSQLVYTS